MLGEILGGLSDPARAADILAALADPDSVDRARQAAAAEGVAVGELVAARTRHLLETAGDALWLDLLGRMSASPQPGAAALAALLPALFPAIPAGRAL